MSCHEFHPSTARLASRCGHAVRAIPSCAATRSVSRASRSSPYCVVALILTGHRTFNADQVEHGEATVSLGSYLTQGHFWEAIFENWESEFLQMAAYVVLTVFLIQKGSAESKDPDEARSRRRRPARRRPTQAGAVAGAQRRDLARALRELAARSPSSCSSSISIVGHALGGVGGVQRRPEGARPRRGRRVWTYVKSSQFWFESFQNWQSEFLAVFAIVALSIFLRQRGSSESKPVAAPH